VPLGESPFFPSVPIQSQPLSIVGSLFPGASGDLRWTRVEVERGSAAGSGDSETIPKRIGVRRAHLSSYIAISCQKRSYPNCCIEWPQLDYGPRKMIRRRFDEEGKFVIQVVQTSEADHPNRRRPLLPPRTARALRVYLKDEPTSFDDHRNLPPSARGDRGAARIRAAAPSTYASEQQGALRPSHPCRGLAHDLRMQHRRVRPGAIPLPGQRGRVLLGRRARAQQMGEHGLRPRILSPLERARRASLLRSDGRTGSAVRSAPGQGVLPRQRVRSLPRGLRRADLRLYGRRDIRWAAGSRKRCLWLLYERRECSFLLARVDAEPALSST